MNTSTHNTPTPSLRRWITITDRLISREMATAFADEGITRRDWRALRGIDAGDARTSNGHRGHGPSVRRLRELGWVTRSESGWTFTDDGRLAKTRLDAAMTEIQARIEGSLSAEELDTLDTALEKVSRAFGWQEGMRVPRRPHNKRSHGHRCHGDESAHDHRGHRHRHRDFDGDERRGFGHERRGHGHGHRGFGRPEQHIHIHTHH